MKRRWQDVVIDWMNSASTRIELFNARRRWMAEVRAEMIWMEAEDKIRRMEEASRRVAARHEAAEPTIRS